MIPLLDILILASPLLGLMLEEVILSTARAAVIAWVLVWRDWWHGLWWVCLNRWYDLLLVTSELPMRVLSPRLHRDVKKLDLPDLEFVVDNLTKLEKEFLR